MNRATWINVVTIGVIFGFAGMTHGFGEILQGNTPTDGMLINAIAAGSRWTRWTEGGEAAFTIIPNFLLTGILATLVGLAIIIWSLGFVHKPHGPLIYLLLFVLLFLVGGGIGQVIFFIPAWAVAHLAAPQQAGARQLEFFVYAYDTARQQLLIEQGYTQTSQSGVIRRLRFADHTLEPAVIAPGYTLRTTNPEDLADCQRIADLLNAAFGRTFHTAREYQNFTRLAPCFRREADMVAVAPDGSFAAYVGVPYDAVNRHATFEPVCTHPAHRRHGLARALMVAGLQRAKALDASDITVETGDMIPANRLYDSIGFSKTCRGHLWRKVF